MAAKYNKQVEIILNHINELEQMYRQAFTESQDVKIMQGFERCIELRMRLFGYDGKTNAATIVDEQCRVAINLRELSDEALQEINQHINSKKL